MAEVSLHIDGLKELDDALQQVEDAFQAKWINGALRASVLFLVREASPMVPRLTGNLVSTLRWSRDRGFGGATVRDYAVVIGKHSLPTDPYYANMVDLGTAPHTIAAKNGGFLHWGDMFARSVQHPGSKADPFMETVLSQGATGAVDAFKFYLGNKLDIATLPEALADPS